MKRIFTIILLGFSCGLFSQNNFYHIDSIREVRINFYESNWDELLDSLYVLGQKERILADLYIDGVMYDSVGVRYKGFSSVSVNRVKNPFNIKLDYIIDGQDHQGIDKIKLSNVISDPSFIREVLTYEIARKYLPSPESNYANLYINDTLWGLYTNVQAINKDFLNDHFGSKYNTFFKCNPDNLDFTIGGENSNLSNTHGLDSLDYEPYYDIRSEYGWEDLYHLIDTLNNYVDSINNILNVDRVLWMHALNYTLINFDSYIGYSQNYYLYKHDNRQFQPILWDLNMSFGSFRLTDASSMYFNGFDILQAQNMDPLIHHSQISIAPRPLLRNLFQNERYRKMYVAHIRTIVNENFINQDYFNRALYIQSLIDISVQNDTNKFYSYSDFINNLNSQVSLVTDICPGITQLMDQRVSYLNNYEGFSGEPTINNISYTPQNFNLGDDLYVTADISNANEAFIYYRFGENMIFRKVPMFDDGNYNDGLANDGLYGAKIPNSSNMIDYYLYADNDSSGVFSPERAAYEFYNIKSNSLQPGDIVINELMSNNTSYVSDPSGDFEDWIELYNPNSYPISTMGLFLTDTLAQIHKWDFPNYTIPANSYAIIWADEDGGQGNRHANFKLSNLGECVILSNLDSIIIDSITYTTQSSNMSFSRMPNGLGPFVIQYPTFNKNNNLSTVIDDIQHTLNIYPNPFTDLLFLDGAYSIEVRDVIGNLIFRGEEVSSIQTSNWSSGIYFVSLNGNRKAIKLIKI